MADNAVVTVPQIDNVTIIPDIVSTSGVFAIYVTASEKTIILEPKWPFSGEILCGQSVIFYDF